MKSWIQSPALHISSIVVHTCNPHTLKMEARELEIQGHPWVYSEVEVSLVYMKLPQKKKNDSKKYCLAKQ